MRKREPSVNLTRIRPTRQTGHHVEFSQQPGDDLFCVGFFGEPIEIGEDFLEGVFCVLDGLGAVVLPLGLQAPMVLKKFFAIKLSECRFTRRAAAASNKNPGTRVLALGILD